MSIDTELILEKVKNLSVSELLTVQESITQELRQKTNSDGTTTATTYQSTTISRRVNIPGSYRPTKEQIEARLAAIFSPEQLEQMRHADLSNLPPGSKTVTEMISEDREDRF